MLVIRVWRVALGCCACAGAGAGAGAWACTSDGRFRFGAIASGDVAQTTPCIRTAT